MVSFPNKGIPMERYNPCIIQCSSSLLSRILSPDHHSSPFFPDTACRFPLPYSYCSCVILHLISPSLPRSILISAIVQLIFCFHMLLWMLRHFIHLLSSPFLYSLLLCILFILLKLILVFFVLFSSLVFVYYVYWYSF